MNEKFIKIGRWFINLDAIAYVIIRRDDSALVCLSGPRDQMRKIPLPSPHGAELRDILERFTMYRIVTEGDFPEKD